MMLTEAEAKERWCPHARVARARDMDGAASNRILARDGEVLLEPAARCVASACAGWRWAPTRPGRVDVEPIGYCGLAGKP